jgi:hypothetical protein
MDQSQVETDVDNSDVNDVSLESVGDDTFFNERTIMHVDMV